MKNQLYSYIFMGVLALVFNWMLYSVCIMIMPMEFANLCSFGLTLVVAYLTNKVWVFHSMDFSVRTLLKEGASFFTARSLTGILEIVMQPQFYAIGITGSLFGVKGLQAKIIVCLILSVLNYLCTKLWVFRPVAYESNL